MYGRFQFKIRGSLYLLMDAFLLDSYTLKSENLSLTFWGPFLSCWTWFSISFCSWGEILKRVQD